MGQTFVSIPIPFVNVLIKRRQSDPLLGKCASTQEGNVLPHAGTAI